MPDGRWDPQTRVAVVGVGALVVTVGVLTTVRWHSELGAAALVFGGLLVGLAGVAGGTVFGPREPSEVRVVAGDPPALNPMPTPPAASSPSQPSPVLALEARPPVAQLSGGPGAPIAFATSEEATLGTALASGDTEGAAATLLRRLWTLAPSAVAYHDAVRAVVATAVEGRTPDVGSSRYPHPLLGPVLAAGLPVAIDVRAGDGCSATAMEQTYQALLDAHPGVGAIVAIVNTGDDTVITAIAELRHTLAVPVIAVGWRLEDPPDVIVSAVATACREALPLVSGSNGPAIPRQSRGDQPTESSNGRYSTRDAEAWKRAGDLHWQGHLQQAEQAYRAIVETRTRALGWDHADTLTARDQHAATLRDLDRLAEALVECDEVLSTRVRVLGADHTDVLTSRSHLASIYHQLGDFTKAETEHGIVLAARNRLLGENHPETLTTRSNLAKVHQDLGELDRAIAEHDSVLRERARVLGAQHRDTLMSRSLLASALHVAGRLPEAAAAHRAALEGRLRLLGPVHLDTAVSRHRLASVLHDLGQLEEAITEYRAAREVYAGLLGPSSPFTRAAASDLALAERALRARAGR